MGSLPLESFTRLPVTKIAGVPSSLPQKVQTYLEGMVPFESWQPAREQPGVVLTGQFPGDPGAISVPTELTDIYF